MTNIHPANDNSNDPASDPPDDALLLLEETEDALTDPGVLGELLADLRIGHRYLLAREPGRASRFLAHSYNVLIARKGLTGAMPDLAARVRQARRIFVDVRVGPDALRALAQGLTSHQRLSGLVRKSDPPVPSDLRCRMSSMLFIDAAVVNVPPALRPR